MGFQTTRRELGKNDQEGTPKTQIDVSPNVNEKAEDKADNGITTRSSIQHN